LLRDEVRAGLVSVAVNTLTTATANGAANVEHARGVLDGVRAAALAFRLDWPTTAATIRRNLADVGLLDELTPATAALLEVNHG